MKAKVFIGDKYLTKVNINKENEIPELNDDFKFGSRNYYVSAIQIRYLPKYEISITIKDKQGKHE